MTFGTWRWWVCQPHALGTFTPRKCSWYSFSLGAESTPGPLYGRKEYVNEKSSDTTGNRSRDRPFSSAEVTEAVMLIKPTRWLTRTRPCVLQLDKRDKTNVKSQHIWYSLSQAADGCCGLITPSSGPYTLMRRKTTFRSTKDCIYDSGPILL